MAGSICNTAEAYFSGLSEMARRIDDESVDRFAGLLVDCWRARGRVFVFGNGGSAYNASHHVCDYVKTASVDGVRPLRAFSLVDNIGIGTAVGNDLSYDDTFSFPLTAYAEPGDLAVAISCSGNSPNVVRACEKAKEIGMTLVALTGFDGGRIGAMADLHINVPSDNYGLIEDLHLSIGHVVSQVFRSRMLSDAAKVS